MTEISKQTLDEVRFQNIEETNLKTGITAILENNELSTKEKVDSLIEFIEIEAESEEIEEQEELISNLEYNIENLKKEIIDLRNTTKLSIIEELKKHIEHPTKPGYRRLDIVGRIKELKSIKIK